MTHKHWDYTKIKLLHIELSTFCNARCPVCPRFATLPDASASHITIPGLVLESISFEDFVKWVPPEFASNLDQVIFCGTGGDPMMAKDVLEITQYLCEHGVGIQFNTNGGMRNTDFWVNLAKIMQNNKPRSGRSRYVTFSIDGLHDTNHLYRVNVPFDDVFRNAKAFIDAGGTAHWDFLIFKHNEHQMDEAAHIATATGFERFTPKKALGFPPDQDGVARSRIVRTVTGEVSHIIGPPSEEHANYLSKSVVPHHHEEKINLVQISKHIKDNPITRNVKNEIYEKAKLHYIPTHHESSTNIVCKSLVKNNGNQEVYISAAGSVYPCCYVGSRMQSDSTRVLDAQVFSEIDNFGVDKISLKNYSLKEIVEGEFLRTVFENKWGKQFPEGMLVCNETCGEENAFDRVVPTVDIAHRKNVYSAMNALAQELDP